MPAFIPASPWAFRRTWLSTSRAASRALISDSGNWAPTPYFSAIDTPDIALIQRWSGLALVGVNLSQKIMLLTGTAGGGKSTLVSVLTGIIGRDNVGMLRTDLLRDRFEIGRLFG